jgi:hypothetical protein
MNELSNTPEPPYYAVIFTSRRAVEHGGYDEYNVRVARVERASSFERVED